MNKIREIRKTKKITQQELGGLVGYEQGAISKIESGKIPLTIELVKKIADVLGVSNSQLIDDAKPIAVAGRVGAGAKVPLVDTYPKGDGLYHVACPPGLSGKGIVAVEIEGDSMYPIYDEGDLLFYRRDALGVPTEAIGRNCICEDERGNAWIKRLKLGDSSGLFNLHSINPSADNMHNVKLKWAAPVQLHWPAELVEKV